MTMKLNPNAVRERAKGISGCKELLNLFENGEHVISFMVGLDQPNTRSQNLARVNVYYMTGTVGTQRVINAKVRQSFRRNINSLDVLERLLRHPEKALAVDEHLIGFDDNDDGAGQLEEKKSAAAADSRGALRSLQKELQLADVGMCILQGERDKLTRHAKALRDPKQKKKQSRSPQKQLQQSQQQQHQQPHSKQKHRQQHPQQHINQKQPQNRQHKQHRQYNEQQQQQYTSQPQRDTPSGDTCLDDENDVPMRSNTDDYAGDDNTAEESFTSSLSGMEFQFSLPADVMAQVDQCLRDITKMDKLVKGVATNGRGTVFLYGNGGVAYTPSIPKALYQKLRQLRNSTFAARPSYVSLGTRDRYFVAFNDGSADWKGPKALDKILKKCIATGQSPLSISFGSTYDTFFVVFHNGSWEYQGRGIPKSLEEKLASRDARADLTTVNLGPSGEWFLKAKNGRMWWSGITDELDKVISEVLQAEHYLHCMDFGEGGSYFVSYDD